MKSKLNKLAWLLLASFVLIQFLQIDKSNSLDNPNDLFNQIDASDQIKTKVKAACYDCHSNETTYPWYTYIQPFGWWVRGHIKSGKNNLNFSEWANYSSDKRSHKAEESAEEIQENHMPLKSYTWMHPHSKLDAQASKMLVDWFDSIQ